MDLRRYLKGDATAETVHEVLRSPVSVLVGMTDAAAAVIEPWHIRTVFDLALSPIFAASAAAAGLGEVGQRLRDVDGVPATLFDVSAVNTDVDRLGSLPLRVLRGVSATKATEVAEVLGAQTLHELAHWPPYRASLELLERVLAAEQSADDDGVPDDLVPSSGTYPTERVLYERLLLDRELTPADSFDTGDRKLPGGKTINAPRKRGLQAGQQVLDGRVDLVGAGPLSLREDQGQQFVRPALGAIARFSQSWYREGLTLGQLLHSVALAPGEMTRVAMIDWSRRVHGEQVESVSQTESLTNSLMRNRAIAEVTDAVATEQQSGRSRAWGQSASAEFGASAAGLGPGATLLGGSLGVAATTSRGGAWSSSRGRRAIAASMSQDIRDATHQAATAARNRRASIVREVSQEESETISTRIVVNYNHMHAMTVQYYEIVQLYRVSMRLEEVDRCLFVPVSLIDFDDPTVVYRHRYALAEAALDATVRAELLEGANSIAVTAPALPNGHEPWSEAQASAMAERVRHPVGPRPKQTIHLPASAKLVTRHLDGQPWIQSGAYGAALRTGETYRTYNWPGDSEGPYSVPVSSLRELTLITYAAPSHEEGVDAAEQMEVVISLPIEVDGQLFHLPFTVTVRREGLTTTRLQFHGGSAATAGVADHLQQHRLHYSKAVWQSLDSVQLTSMLAPYHLGGEPLTEVVDPVPLTMAGNYLVFRLRTDPTQNEEWRAWLAEHGLDVGESAVDVVALPSGGVHAEAVLGRANSAEKLDITRFWNWQDSPIPIQAPEISPVSAGSRAHDEDLTPGTLSQPIVNITNPPALPDPAGMAAVLGAVSNGSLFRDMSDMAAAAQLANAALAASSAGASHAATQAGTNAATYAELLKAAAQAAAAIATGGAVGAPSALSTSNPSRQGAVLNHAKSLDQAKEKAPGPPAPSGPAGSAPGSTSSTAPHSGSLNHVSESAQRSAFDSVIGRAHSNGVQQANWTREVTAPQQLEPGPILGGPIAVAIAPPAAERRVSVVLRAFIPAPIIAPPDPLGVADATGYPIPVFAGDGRGFDLGANSHRAEIRVTLTPDTTVASPILEGPFLDFGETHEYQRADAEPVPGKPSWWWQLTEGHGQPQVDEQTVTPDRINVQTWRVKNPDLWWVDFNIHAPLAATDWRIDNTAPAIDAWFRLALRTNNETGLTEYMLTGSHDGFPAYEMYLNGQKAYLWDPAAHGSSPLALAGEMDVTVSTSRSDLDARPGFRPIANQMA